MAASNTDARATENRTRGLTRYDLLLLVIPATFVVALLVATVSPFSASTLLAAASVVGAIAVADGLFINPPSGPERP